jgi:hypothetical protein
VLSSLFRVTDGIRMTTYAMMFSIEHTRRADEPLTAQQLHTHVEQNGVFVGETGVCAGPKPMVDDFLATAVDGVPPEGIANLELAPQVREALAQLPEAVDYAFYALQSESVSLSLWLAMSRAYKSLLAILDPVIGPMIGPAVGPVDGASQSADPLVKLCKRLRAGWALFEKLQITLDYDQEVHFKAYLNVYEQSWRGLRSPIGPPTLAEVVAPVPEAPMHRTAADQLRDALGPVVAHGELASKGLDIDRIVDVLVRYLREEQAVLRSVVALQETINTLLERPRPRRPLTARDFAVHYALISGPGAWPYLFDLLEKELGVRVECTATAIEVSARRAS